MERAGSFPWLRLPRMALLPLFGVLLVALSLRLWGIGFGLPYLYHPDEPGYVSIAQQMLKTGDLNPHFFNYPSVFLYINSLAYVPYYLVGKSMAVFHSRADVLSPQVLVMGAGYAPLPTEFMLGRSLSVLFGTATVAVVFLATRKHVGNAVAGLLAGMMMAVSPANVASSHFVTPDACVVFFASLSLYALLPLVRSGKVRYYLLAGVACGLTASAKYNGGLVLLPAVLAHFLRPGSKGFRDWRLYALLACSVAAFLIGTPFALLDHQEFLADLTFEARHYSTGHAGMEGSALGWYLEYLWTAEGPVVLLAALQILRGIWLRSRELLVLSAFPIAYFALICSAAVRNDRTAMPLTPFLFVLAASLLYEMAARIRFDRTGQVSLAALAALILVSLVLPLETALRNDSQLTVEDSRATARLWIDRNLPAGSRVAIESYSPYVDPQRFSVQPFGKLIDQPPQWYADNGFDYLVFSEGMFGRFFAAPERYKGEVSQYNRFFSTLQLVKSFNDGDYDVRVFLASSR